MKKRIVFGSPLPGDPQKKLEGKYDFYVPETTLTQEEFESASTGADAVITLLSHRVDAGFLDRFPDIGIISNYAVGYNNIDVEETSGRGVIVTNTPDVLTETTADLAWALMMSAARRIVEADAFMRAGKFNGWTPWLFLGRDVWGKCMGIIGFGRIGRATARRARGFGMKILYHDPSSEIQTLEDGFPVQKVELADLLKRSDFVSIHCPLSDETKHLIGKRELALMKSSAILVNTARGPVVDEAALVDALRKGVIAAAGLDVYEYEPETASGLLDLSQVVVAPHIGSGTAETREKMAHMAVDAVIDFLSGDRPAHMVNPEAWTDRIRG